MEGLLAGSMGECHWYFRHVRGAVYLAATLALRGSSASWGLEFLALGEFRPFGDGWVGEFGSFGNFRTIGTFEIF